MKKVIFGIAAIAIGLLVVIRIESVNKNITYPEIKEYGMQEEAPIGDNIFMEDYEKMDRSFDSGRYGSRYFIRLRQQSDRRDRR